MAAPRVLAIVLAGGEGKRLMPLTKDRAKPAVPFGGLYRLVDRGGSNFYPFPPLLARPLAGRGPLVAALLAVGVLAAGVLLACDGSGGSAGLTGGPGVRVEATARVTSGLGLRGLELDLRHDPGAFIDGVLPQGALIAGNCAVNPETGRLRVACVTNQPFDAPLDAWIVSFSLAGGASLDGVVTSIACRGAGSSGATFPVTCSLVVP